MFSIAVVSLEINLLMKVEAGEIVSAEAIASNDTRRMALAVLYICVFIATILAFCRWINRASRTLRELDVYNQEFTPLGRRLVVHTALEFCQTLPGHEGNLESKRS